MALVFGTNLVAATTPLINPSPTNQQAAQFSARLDDLLARGVTWVRFGMAEGEVLDYSGCNASTLTWQTARLAQIDQMFSAVHQRGMKLLLLTGTPVFFTTTSQTAPTIIGATSFTLANILGIRVGQTLTFGDSVIASGVSEPLTVATIVGNVITTTTGATKAHGAGSAVSYSQADYINVTTLFFQFIAARWANAVDAWEVYNEANLGDFRARGTAFTWNGTDTVPALTAAYLSDLQVALSFARTAIRTSSAKPITTSVGELVANYDALAQTGFEVFFDPITAFLDVTGIHMYDAMDPATVSTRVGFFQTLATRYSKPIWITEFGEFGNRYDSFYTEALQAKVIPQQIAAFTAANVAVAMQFRYIDPDAGISSVTITDHGSYATAPTGVTFSAGTGSTATGTVQTTGTGPFTVTGVTLTTVGDYLNAPTVTFTGGVIGGGGHAATAVANLNVDYLGLLRADGTPKAAYGVFPSVIPPTIPVVASGQDATGGTTILSVTPCDWNGNTLGGIPTLIPKSANIFLTSLDEFPESGAIFGADQRNNLNLLTAFRTLKFNDKQAGAVLGWKILQNPSLQISDTGDEITLQLPNITDQLTNFSVGTGAVFETTIGSIVSQVGAQGETIEWETIYSTLDPNANPFAADFFASGPDYTRVYDATGALIQVLGGTGKFSGWGAVMLDDGPNVLSAMPAIWGAYVQTLFIDGNNIDKQTASFDLYDGTAQTSQQITLATTAGVAARSDGAFQWTARDVSSEYIAGLAVTTGTLATDITYGFQVFKTTTTTPANPSANAPAPTGTWKIYEAGVNPSSGGTVVTGNYVTGDIFSVAVDYTSGSPVIIYAKNGHPLYQSAHAPTLPYKGFVALKTPGGGIQNAIVTATTTPSQQWYAITFNQQTPLEALIQLIQGTNLHLRQRRDYLGSPLRVLEVGNFGEQSGVTLVSAARGDLDRMLANSRVRVVTAMRWSQETSQIYNTVTPLGANTGDLQVDLEKAWQIVNDPTYDNYWSKYGALANIFPEYDGVNYPIKRTLGRNGQWEYYIVDTKAYAALGMEIRGKYVDPQFAYTDTTLANQELTARALYLATIAHLKVSSQVNDVLEVETVAGKFLPPLAGSRVTVDFARISGDTRGNFAVMSTQTRTTLANPYVISVERVYAETDVKEVWKLATVLRALNGSASGSAASLRQADAIQIMQQNSVCYLPVVGDEDVDANPTADHSCIAEVRIPNDVFRITSAPIDVTFRALRQQVKTAQNQTQAFQITIPMSTVTITTQHDNASGTSHALKTLSGGSYDGSKGFATSDDALAAIPDHRHFVAITSDTRTFTVSSTPTTLSPDRYVSVVGDGAGNMQLNANGHSGTLQTNGITGGPIDLTVTKHGHHSPIDQHLTVPLTLSGLVDQQTINADLPLHTHPIDTALNDVAQPTLVDLYIDQGDGVFVYLSNIVTDALSGGTGPWSSSFHLADISKYVNKPGKLVRIKLVSRDTAGNFGIGHLKIRGLWRAEIGGLGSKALITH